MKLDASLATGTRERKREVRLLLVWAFILVAAILAIAALISDHSLTPDQRIAVYQQSGVCTHEPVRRPRLAA
jgi:hypothetical protein